MGKRMLREREGRRKRKQKSECGFPKTGDTSAVVCGNHARIPRTTAILKTTAIVSSLQNNLS